MSIVRPIDRSAVERIVREIVLKQLGGCRASPSWSSIRRATSRRNGRRLRAAVWARPQADAGQGSLSRRVLCGGRDAHARRARGGGCCPSVRILGPTRSATRRRTGVHRRNLLGDRSSRPPERRYSRHAGLHADRTGSIDLKQGVIAPSGTSTWGRPTRSFTGVKDGQRMSLRVNSPGDGVRESARSRRQGHQARSAFGHGRGQRSGLGTCPIRGVVESMKADPVWPAAKDARKGKGDRDHGSTFFSTPTTTRVLVLRIGRSKLWQNLWSCWG